MYFFIIKYKSTNQDVRAYDGHMYLVAKNEEEASCLVENELKSYNIKKIKNYGEKVFDIIEQINVDETEIPRVITTLDFGWH